MPHWQSSNPSPPTRDRVRRALASRSLYEFGKQAWDILEPGTEYLDNWHIELISEHMEAVINRDIRRLIVNIPPRYMKSLAITIFSPCWSWIKHPALRWMFASYSSSLSLEHSIKRRLLIQSEWYQREWPLKLLFDQNQKSQFSNTHLGTMIATSVGGTSTGKGGDILVLDDPINPQQAMSDLERTGANDWVRRTFSTRLNDKKKGAIVVVMQRLHEMDTTGMLLEQGGWEHLCIPIEPKRRTVYHFPISLKELVREPGQVLWEEREGPDELHAQKLILGSYGYAGQYEQEPSPAEGGILKKHWWRFWYPRGQEAPAPVLVRLADGTMHSSPQTPLPVKFDEALQTWDLAFKSSADSSMVCGGVMARAKADFFLLDLVRDKLGFVDSIQSILRMKAKWPKVVRILIEDKANGPAVIEVLQKEIPGIVAVNPEGDKVTRAAAVSPALESGNMYLPHPSIAPWVDGFIDEAAKFPNSAYKDQVDTWSQGLLKLMKYKRTWKPEKDQETVPGVETVLKAFRKGREKPLPTAPSP